MTVVAELKGVTKRYGSGENAVLALRGIDLTLQAGEVTLIEGPSGGGKTTLLQILGLLLPADEGTVTVAGRQWHDAAQAELTEARRKHIAFVFQDFNLLSSLSAHDNVAVVAGLHGRNRDGTARDILAKLGLVGRGHHLPGAMSGGQKQRVSIGRALASPGELVLADEPTANLDWSVGEPIIRILSQMARTEGRSVVIVSHDARLEPLVDRIVRLSDGQIQSDQRQEARVLAPPVLPATAPAAAPRRSRHHPWAIAAGVLVLALVSALLALKGLGFGPLETKASISAASSATAPAPAPAPPVAPGLAVVAAAPAVTEPASRVVQLTSDRLGTIKALPVKPGETVEAGQPLVILDDQEAKSLVDLRAAEVASAEAALADLRAGTRPERREEAAAKAAAAQVRLVKAQHDADRVREMQAKGGAGQADLQATEEALGLAKAEVRGTEALVKLAEAGPTATEIGLTQARVTEAKAQLAVARVTLELRIIRSPVRGKVLYLYVEPGEAVGPMLTTTPILSLAATGKMRLRAEVDEIDIGRIKVGQRVVATAEPFPGREFRGVVCHQESLMGRRNIRTNRPTEQQDTRVREVVIELDESASDLPVDLLMTVRFLENTTPATAS